MNRPEPPGRATSPPTDTGASGDGRLDEASSFAYEIEPRRIEELLASLRKLPRTQRAPLIGAGAALALLVAVAIWTPGQARVPPTNPSRTSVASSPEPSNLLTGSRATFTGSSSGWVPVNSRLSEVPAADPGSAGALAMTSTATGGDSAWSGLPSAGGLTPVSAGGLYSAGAVVSSSGASIAVAEAEAFFDSSGHELDVVWGPGVTATSSVWVPAPTMYAIAPPSATYTAFGVLVNASKPGQTVLIESPFITVAPDHPAANVSGPLHTSGNQIVDSLGHSVLLRGVVLTGLEQSAYVPAVTEQAVLQAKDWGANLIRVPLGEQFWLSSNCDHAAGYASFVDQLVDWITSLGMVALLDLHTNTVGGCQAGATHDMADAAQAPEFWKQVAARYASNPLVAFDLYNEPHDISDAVWLNGGTVTDSSAPAQSYQAAGMQQLYDAVRSSGAGNLVLVSGNNWATTLPTNLVHGTNIVYGVHAYTCSQAAPPLCANSDPLDPSQILGSWVAPSATVPVMVTEFGWPSQSDGTYASNVIAFAQSHDWGWAAFAWDPSSEAAWSLVEQYTASGPYEPSPSGMPVLSALAGT